MLKTYRITGDYGIQDAVVMTLKAKNWQNAKRNFIRKVKNEYNPSVWERMGEYNVHVTELEDM